MILVYMWLKIVRQHYWVYGLEGLIWDIDGNWLLGFPSNYDITINMNVELQAIFHDLQMAWNNGFWPVECESDC